MKKKKIVFIGAGNMASSLIEGLVKDGYDANNLYACDHHPEKLKNLQKNLGIHISTDNQKLAEEAEVIVLAVKPFGLKKACEEIQDNIAKNKPLIISIATGITTQKIATYLNANVPIVRCMPNTPALVRSGSTVLFATANVTQAQKDLAESILRAVGITIWVTDEKLIDSVTALSGSGPAYFFLIMEILEKIGIQMGIEPEAAHLLTLQTGLGAAKLAIESDYSLETLRQKVTSPGGTTEAALKVFKEMDLENILSKALFAAKNRAEEIAINF